MLKTLDLFSGIGGFSRGLEATGFFETICFVENELYCQAVLKHHWPGIPVLGDIRDVKGEDLPIQPDLVCGGFPCQPFSHAGKQRAQDDPRHLWPEMFRLIRECRPTWVIGENVAGIIKLGLDEVLSDLADEGYATRTFNIPACAVGAPHLRQRLWIVAHSDSESEPDKPIDGGAGARQLGFEFVADAASIDGQRSIGQGGCTREPEAAFGDGGGVVADASSGRQRRSGKGQMEQSGRAETKRTSETLADAEREGKGRGRISGSRKDKREDGKGSSSEFGRHREAVASGECSRPEVWWKVEPPVGRVVDGLPNRVPQLRALGNSIIPQIAQEIGEAIKVTYDI